MRDRGLNRGEGRLEAWGGEGGRLEAWGGEGRGDKRGEDVSFKASLSGVDSGRK